MNEAGIKAIERALANVEDNLYRYRHFMHDDATTGNGRSKREVVASLERERDELKASLEQARA